jgi:hypothetical protein
MSQDLSADRIFAEVLFVNLDFFGTRIDGNDARREAFRKLVCEMGWDRLLDENMR